VGMMVMAMGFDWGNTRWERKVAGIFQPPLSTVWTRQRTRHTETPLAHRKRSKPSEVTRSVSTHGRHAAGGLRP